MDIEELAGLEPESPETEHAVYELFKWSVILKGLISLAEVVVGTLILIIPASLVVGAVEWLHTSVPEGASYGFIAEHLLKELEGFSAATILFVALYLLSRGLIKCFIIWGLLKNMLWAYPASLIVLGAFLLYQFYQIATIHSFFVIGITLFDLVVIYSIWREWRIVKRHRAQIR